MTQSLMLCPSVPGTINQSLHWDLSHVWWKDGQLYEHTDAEEDDDKPWVVPQVTIGVKVVCELLTQRILQGVVEIRKCWIWMDFRGPQNLGRQKHPHLNSVSLLRTHVKRPPYPFTPSGSTLPWCENYVRSPGHRPIKPWWIWFWNSVHPNYKSANTPQRETLSLSSVSIETNRQTHWSLLRCPYTLSAPPLEPATHSSN